MTAWVKGESSVWLGAVVSMQAFNTRLSISTKKKNTRLSVINILTWILLALLYKSMNKLMENALPLLQVQSITGRPTWAHLSSVLPL